MKGETRYPQDDEAPMDRFDARDSAQAKTETVQVLTFAKSVLALE